MTKRYSSKAQELLELIAELMAESHMMGKRTGSNILKALSVGELAPDQFERQRK